MKAILLNGSPHSEGNTYFSLKTVADVLGKNQIETEIIHVCSKPEVGCVGCNACLAAGMCVFADEAFKEISEKVYSADALVLGSPVYYSGINGTFKCFLDRFFYQSKSRMRHKAAASVAIPRRTGGMPALEQLNSYLLYSEMLLVGSSYWNVVHGAKPGEVLSDAEGIATLECLGRNLAWVLKMMEYSKSAIPAPDKVKKPFMNFIR